LHFEEEGVDCIVDPDDLIALERRIALEVGAAVVRDDSPAIESRAQTLFEETTAAREGMTIDL